MDNASKNAGEMITKFQILFNRTRQAVITGELVEIITGAAASLSSSIILLNCFSLASN
jgi:F-type H+-transporting ATPase subunit gamma